MTLSTCHLHSSARPSANAAVRASKAPLRCQVFHGRRARPPVPRRASRRTPHSAHGSAGAPERINGRVGVAFAPASAPSSTRLSPPIASDPSSRSPSRRHLSFSPTAERRRVHRTRLSRRPGPWTPAEMTNGHAHASYFFRRPGFRHLRPQVLPSLPPLLALLRRSGEAPPPPAAFADLTTVSAGFAGDRPPLASGAETESLPAAPPTRR